MSCQSLSADGNTGAVLESYLVYVACSVLQQCNNWSKIPHSTRTLLGFTFDAYLKLLKLVSAT